MSPRILILDIETSPHSVDAWGLYNVNVGIPQIQEPSRMISVAAKWLGEKKTKFWSVHHDPPLDMVLNVYDMMNEADAIITYNGNSFDLPVLNREFVLLGLPPPSPFKSIDLYRVVRSTFKFASNKLAYVTVALGLEGKVPHTGHQLWTDCAAGDPQAWKLMKKYNIQDVVITEELYLRVLPWIISHPNLGLYNGATEGCPNCGSLDLERRGYAYTTLGKFQRRQCKSCGKWSRDSKRLGTVTIQGVR